MSSMTMSSSSEDPFLTPVIKAFDHVTAMLEHNKKVYIEKRSRLQELMERKTEIEQAGPVPSPDPIPNQQQQPPLEQPPPPSSPPHGPSRTGSTGFYSTIQSPPSNIIHSPSSSPSTTPITPPPTQPSLTSQNPVMPPPLATSTPLKANAPITSAISSISSGTSPSHLIITDETSGRNPYRAPSGLSSLRPLGPTVREGSERTDPGATYIVPTPSGFTTPSQSGGESSSDQRSEDPTGFSTQQSRSSSQDVGGSTQQSSSTHQGGFTQSSDSTPPPSGSTQPSDPAPPPSGFSQPSDSTPQSDPTPLNCGPTSNCANGTTTGFQVLHCPDCNAKLGIVFEIFHMDGNCPGNEGTGTAHTHN